MTKSSFRVGRASSVDDKILRLAVEGLSPEEISRKLDGLVSPARVVLRTEDILKRGDWLSDAQQERALLRVMQKNLSDLQSDLNVVSDPNLYKISLEYIKELQKRFDKRSNEIDVQVDRYNRNVGVIMGRVVDKALSYMKGALRREVDPDRWDELVEEALVMARNDIAQHEVEQGHD